MLILAKRSSILAFAALLVLVPVSTPGQSVQRDKAGSLKLAHRFTRRMQQTLDIRPLIREMGTVSFLRTTIKDAGTNIFLIVEPELLKALDERSMFELYVEGTNWMYLGQIYNCVHNKSLPESDDRPDAMYPKMVKAILKSDRFLRIFPNVGDDENDNDEAALPDRRQLAELTVKFNRMNRIYRNELKTIPAMKYDKFLELYGKCSDDTDDNFDATSSVCKKGESCHGFKPGTRTFRVDVPWFDFLEIINIRGELKIFSIPMFDD